MRKLTLGIGSFLAIGFAVGTATAKPKKAPPPATAAPAPPVEPVYTGIDDTAIDSSVKACDDFYQYACGGWLKRTEIPADKSTWVRSFSVIDAENEKRLQAILEAAAKGELKDAGPVAQKVGDLWTSCMDENGADAATPAAVKAALAKIDTVKDKKSLIKAIGQQHVEGTPALFNIGSQQDFADATQMIGVVDRGGMGLPDKDYYLKDDERMKKIRDAYVAHVQKILELGGWKPADAAAAAKVVMKIETELAKASLSRTDRRDPHKIYHRINLDGLQKIAPRFDWKLYLQTIGHADITQINVTEDAFIKTVDELVGKTISIADWKTYLKWWALHEAAPKMSKAFVTESWDFYGKTLAGQKEQRPRWKRCVKFVDAAMGQGLGELFVKRHFSDKSKSETRAIVEGIEQAFVANLESLGWMDAETKKASAAKAGKIANQIGYPDKWLDYSKLSIDRGSFIANLERAAIFEQHRQLNKVGKPVDRSEWFMTPPQVNAYYDPSMNMMVFPAGILQGAFYDEKALRAVNYGAIGMVMGHELTHGFDDEGRQFDGLGNLRDWWTKTSGAEFEKRAQCVVEQYGGYTAIEDKKLNGKLTLGENIADIGGIKLAYAAYKAQRKGPTQKIAGSAYTDDQLFFLGYAQAWCGKRRDEEERMRVVTDPHSPPRFRVNGPLSDNADFAAAFQCAPGAPMAPKNACSVW